MGALEYLPLTTLSPVALQDLLPSSMLIWAVAAACLAVVVYGFHPVQQWKLRHIPGPRPVWLIGIVKDVLTKGFPRAKTEYAEKYGSIFKVFLGGQSMVVITDPLLARKVNMKFVNRSPIPSLLAGEEKAFDDAGMLTARDEHWRSIRAAWQPIFYTGSLEVYVDLMNAAAERLCACLGQHAQDGQELDIWRMFGAMTMEVVGTSAFGIDLKTLTPPGEPPANPDDDGQKLLRGAQIVFGFSGMRDSPYAVLNAFFPILSTAIRRVATALPDPNLKRVIEARCDIREILYRLIAETRAQDAATQQTNGKSEGADERGVAEKGVEARRRGVKPGSFLHMLIHSTDQTTGKPFTDMQIAAQAFTFVLAGYETTASTLGYAVYELCANPACEAALLQEVDSFGPDFVPTYQDLDKLRYTEAVLKETLRLLPPAVQGTVREAKQEFELGGYLIPKGTQLNTAMGTFQTSSEYWQDAEQFKPERFLEGTAASQDFKANPAAFAPFGDGSRSCIGLRFAMMEAKIALLKLYQRYTLRLTPGQIPLETVTRLTLAPKHGIFVTVHPRS